MSKSNYDLYRKAAFNQPSYYPIRQSIAPELYRPIATWMGRLILPTKQKRNLVKGALFEIIHADSDRSHLVGQIVKLRWSRDPEVQRIVQSLAKDVRFTKEAEDSKRQGNIHGDRLNGWGKVNPLESLAGARPEDDVMVMLPEPVTVEEKDGEATLFIGQEPIQITGTFYGLVSIVDPTFQGSDRLRVRHFNPESRIFDGREEIVLFPKARANKNGALPSTNRNLEMSPLNGNGWYIYGAKNAQEIFTVQALAPRSLLRLYPDETISTEQATTIYLKKQAWQDPASQKGQTKVAFLASKGQKIRPSMSQWQKGDRALVLHLFGGIGGKKKEFAPMGISFGHFAYGVARVIQEPLADELRFDIEYKQIYTHNTDGIISGTLSWANYIGDRQRGWLGSRPIGDIIVKLDCFTEDYDFDGIKLSPLNEFIRQLDIMAARYRIGDGTGATFVGPANSCVQDSQQALFMTIKIAKEKVQSNTQIQDWLKRNPHHPQAQRFRELVLLRQSLERKLIPLGIVRSDWEKNTLTLGKPLGSNPLRNVFNALASWRSLLPRLAWETVAEILLQHGASMWVLRANQVGGLDPDIEPIAPTILL